VFAFDDSTSQFAYAGELASGRTGHACIPLADGTILVLGGASTTSGAPNAERFDPRSGRSHATASQPISRRSQHTATLLADGRELLALQIPGAWAANGGALGKPPLSREK
jgi:hypothetical protein